jgi:rubrerythrin
MAKFIPIDKMKKLREASKTGDERAKKILAMQMDGKEDFGPLMDEYFTPAPQPVVEEQPATGNSKLEEFLKFNGVTKDSPDYQSYVDEFNKETGGVTEPTEPKPEDDLKEIIKKRIKEEIDAIASYSKGVSEVMALENVDEGLKRKIISRFKEIDADEEQHRSELMGLLQMCDSKPEENNDETI